MAITVPSKGGTGRFQAERCREFMEENCDGARDVIVKGDQEKSLEVVFRDLLENRLRAVRC